MVDQIYTLKNEILKRTDSAIHERGIERMNVTEVGELVDMVKDLAQAEAYCWKAEYYKTVTSAMKGESNRYDPSRLTAQGGMDTIGETSHKMMRYAGPDEREHMHYDMRGMVSGM